MERRNDSLFNGCKKVLLVAVASIVILRLNLVVTAEDRNIFRRDEDGNNLDYVSLTDSSWAKLSDNEEGTTNWVVSKASCMKLQPGCICDLPTPEHITNTAAPFPNAILCQCKNAEQVVNLKEEVGNRVSNSNNGHWKWTIQGCSKVIISRNFLSGFFGSESNLQVEFNNISSLIIQESAFFLKDSGSSSHGTDILFNNCAIDNIPPKSFPSYLGTIKFLNCGIKTLSSNFVQSLRMDRIVFDGTTVNDTQPHAFSENTIIDSLVAKDSYFQRIHPNALASGIQHLNWSGCSIGHIQENGVSGLIVRVVIERSTIYNIETHGLAIKSWTLLSLVNNTFTKVATGGIDLTHIERQLQSIQVFIDGNTWENVETDFIITGTSEEPFAQVRNNSFTSICTCESTFASFLSLNGSRSWFIDQVFNASRCQTESKVKSCLESSRENRTEDDDFIKYEELPLLCSPEVFMCMSEVLDVPVNPQFPDRLRLLALIIGAFVLFMIVSLLLTMLVYILRKKRPQKLDRPADSPVDQPRKEFVKSFNNDQYAAINPRMSKTPSMPTRIALLEDIEMEDKGVQTLPTDLSADIIEGLREKLSKPDSFWDAKETIDHLYDLIHVRDQAALPTNATSPPDVTVCSGGDNRDNMLATFSPSNHVISQDSLKLLISPSRKLPLISKSDRSIRNSMSTFAQTPSPSKSAPICDYRDPSDSQLHIYSELTIHPSCNGDFAKGGVRSSTGSQNNHQISNPILCDYTEPRDFQTHIYAELAIGVPLSEVNSASPSKQSHTTQTGFDFEPNRSDTTPFSVKDVPNSLPVISRSPFHNQFNSSVKKEHRKSFGVQPSESDFDVSGTATLDISPSQTRPKSFVDENSPRIRRPLPSIPIRKSFSPVK